MLKISTRLMLTLLLAALASTACSPFAIVPSTQAAPTPIVQVIPADTEAPETTIPTEEPSAAGPARFMLFNRPEKLAIAYDADGNEVYRIPTPGLEYPAPYSTSIVDGAVYYVSPMDHAIIRANQNEAVRVDIPTDENLYAIAVSPDDTMIAWSNFYGDFESARSTLWIANTDGSNAREVITYSASQAGGKPSAAFNLMPVSWTTDGKLLFDRTITGLGGYILFFGYHSLYSYDPATAQFETIVPAEEDHGISLDTYRLDLDRVVFNTRGLDSPITIRNLQDQSEVTLPKVGEQGLGGSIRYSPSGAYIAYAVARSNPEDEAGNVVVVPADLSTEPASILHVDGNRAPYIHGWLDEDTILFATNHMDAGQVWSIRRDGSELTLLAEGQLMAMIR